MASLHCVYVKRELRALAVADREALLDAMHQVWAVPTRQSRERYGPTYTGMDQFVAVHADQVGAGSYSCTRGGIKLVHADQVGLY